MSQSIAQNELLQREAVGPSIQLYGNENIDALSWNHSEEEPKTGFFFSNLIKKGVGHYIDKVNTELMLLSINNQLIPITINHDQYENSWVCSPYAHYVSYSYIVLNGIKNKIVKNLLSKALDVYGNFLRKGKINKVVIVNNWLFTTTPHLAIDSEKMRSILNYLKVKFPDHAIVFRSVTPEVSQEFYKALKGNGFEMIASRLIYLTNAKDETIFHTRIFKSDLKLLRESKYTILTQEEIKEEDLPKIVELYRALYIQKYSDLNPQFNLNFIKLAKESGVLHLTALKLNDQIEGVFGYFYQNGIMISPFFGYDPVKSENNGIYRILSSLLMLEAQKLGAIFNQSAGGSFFKKIRKAEGHLEYTAVYSRHLPLGRRFRWMVLKGILNSIGAQYMKRY